MECVDIDSTQIHHPLFRPAKDSADESGVVRTVFREVPCFDGWWHPRKMGNVHSHV